jgi:hypothetical protein
MVYIGNTAGNRFVTSTPASVYSGDGSTTVFTLEHSVGSDEDILVSVDGVVQEPSVAYAVSNGTTLTFTGAPSNNAGNNIFVYYLHRTVASVNHSEFTPLKATTGTFSGNVSVGGNLDVTGSLDMSDANLTNVGSIQLDSISGDADTDTNITFSGSDVITFTTGGSTAFTANANQSVTFSGSVTGITDLTMSGNLTVDTNTLFVDAANNRVGIGTSSPSSPLHISLPSSGTDVEGWRVSSGGGGILYVRVDDASSANPTWEMNVASSEQLSFGIGASEAMRIDDSRNVGIGTNSPSAALHILDTSTPQAKIAYDSNRYMNVEHATIYNVSGAAQSNNLKFATRGYSGNNNITFFTGGTDASGTSESERMRIDSSGNLLVGTTDISPYDNTSGVGIALRSTGAIYNAINGGTALILNRMTSNGTIAQFRQGGTTVGSIGTNDGALEVGSGDVYLQFNGTNDWIKPVDGSGSNKPNVDLGTSGAKFKDLYLSGTAKIEKSGQALNLDTPSASQNVWMNFSDNGSAKWEIQKNTANLLNIYSYDLGSNVMTFNGSGNVGIGTSPSHKLEVHSANATNIVAKSTNGNGGYLNYSGLSSGGTTTFSVTHNGNVYAADGINLGGTGSANQLDDYEEGTWTPAVYNGAVTLGTIYRAAYVKVGKLVFVQLYAAISASGNASPFQLDGLPFSTPATGYATGSVDFGRGGVKGQLVRKGSNNDRVEFLYPSESLSTDRVAIVGNQVDVYVIFSITYETTA